MGIYVNPGNTAFEMSCHSNIYVDKTMLISITNNLYRSEQRFLCVSRPRRFGWISCVDYLKALIMWILPI